VSNARFTRSERLLRGEDYRTTIAKRCRSDDRLFTVYAAKGPTGGARLGITVSRRVSTKAVRRNRLKRCVRESFRYHKQPLAGLDLVVIARLEANETGRLQVNQSLFGHWRRVREKCGK
jgi:ribonuclease P protein component|tara:strand:+ start:684 stop:1040 length:357 start_codon:yes stop_codon:yes gene_type:complete